MTVLCYHAIEPAWRAPLAVPAELFAAHCAYLARRREVLPVRVAVERMGRRWTLPGRQTALTFDDGFASVRTGALPALVRHRLPAAVFVVAETLTTRGRPVDWLDDPPDVPVRTLDLDELRELQDGGVEVGSHSWAHQDLTTLSERECVDDLTRSRELLEDLLGRRVGLLAYPRGRHAAHVRRAAEKAGYSYAFGLPETSEEYGPYAIPRAGVFPWNGSRIVGLKTRQAYLRLRTSPVFPVVRRRLGLPQPTTT